ncbi:hypothetical protein C8R47DRAFT_1066230 [Mycena vitilis]|nr:hypothetical protein C8R47DRAFT_1066230 [Mycena vitilis]
MAAQFHLVSFSLITMIDDLNIDFRRPKFIGSILGGLRIGVGTISAIFDGVARQGVEHLQMGRANSNCGVVTNRRVQRREKNGGILPGLDRKQEGSTAELPGSEKYMANKFATKCGSPARLRKIKASGVTLTYVERRKSNATAQKEWSTGNVGQESCATYTFGATCRKDQTQPSQRPLESFLQQANCRSVPSIQYNIWVRYDRRALSN